MGSRPIPFVKKPARNSARHRASGEVKRSVLRHWSENRVLFKGEINLRNGAFRSSVLSCMFFWPEEYGLTSECVNYARRFELRKIHEGCKEQRARLRLLQFKSQVVVHAETNGSAAAGAFRLDIEGEWFVSKLPLHEGRRNSVSASGGPEPLAAAKSNRCGVGSVVTGYAQTTSRPSGLYTNMRRRSSSSSISTTLSTFIPSALETYSGDMGCPNRGNSRTTKRCTSRCSSFTGTATT